MASPNGDIYLLRNIPLTASYEHTIDFKNKDEQYGYFFGFRKHVLTNYSYIRKEREYIAVELPLSALDDVNYLFFRSSEGDRLYYAFVTNKVYVNPTTSQIFYTIDVMQTYMFDYEWRESYIQQAHVDRWTADHKPIYSKTEEGIAYGTEYVVENAYALRQSSELRWLLITLKDYSALDRSGYDTNVGYFQPVGSPFVCALVPIILSADKSSFSYIDTSVKVSKNGVNIYGVDSTSTLDTIFVSTFEQVVRLMQSSALGNYVVSINLLTYNPFILNEVRDSNGAFLITLNSKCTYGYTQISRDGDNGVYANFLIVAKAPKEIFSNILSSADWNIGIEGSMPTAEQWAEIKAKPRKTKRDKRFESKLLCAPYRFNILTDWRNEPTIFKNEYMTTDKIEINYTFAMSHNVPFRYWIKDYKKDPIGRNTSLLAPLSPEMPIISDAYYTYLLENRNTIQANLTNSFINAGASTLSGAISGGGIGGPAGALYGGITGFAQGALNVQSQIRSENAKQRDLKAVPDHIINNVDSAFNIVDGTDELNFYRMRICCENEEIISEIFNISGYKVNRIMLPNTRSRVRFNYLQTVGANIVGSFNQDDILKIKEIYDKGITIWHYSDTDFYPLDYSYENLEVNLL